MIESHTPFIGCFYSVMNSKLSIEKPNTEKDFCWTQNHEVAVSKIDMLIMSIVVCSILIVNL